MGGGSFGIMFKIAILLSVIWGAGRLAKFGGISVIIPQILAGLIMGPEVLDFIPRVYSKCAYYEYRDVCDKADWDLVVAGGDPGAAIRSDPDHGVLGMSIVTHIHDKYGDKCSNGGYLEDRVKGDTQKECFEIYCRRYWDTKCSYSPDIFTLIGHIGVSLMIFESGMHFHFPMLPIVGPKGSVVAVLGTFGPIVMGILCVLVLTDESIYSGLVAGVAMAPTSVGIALTLLMETKQLDETYGQLIITAAFLDDILSLIAFSLLFSIDENGVTLEAFLPAIFGTIFLVLGGWLAARVAPGKLEELFSWIKSQTWGQGGGHWTAKEKVHLLLMIVFLLFYAWLTDLMKGSHLWGCFVAGMTFSGVHSSVAVWSRQTKRVNGWLMKIFFAGTVGFSIPVNQLLDIENFAYGMVMGCLACLAPKVFCACWIGEERWVVGWAMCGRAEFAFLIAAMGKTGGLLSSDLYSITIWALLLATICAPIGFQKTLKSQIIRNKAKREAKIAEQGGHHHHHGHNHGHGHGETPDGHGDATPGTGKSSTNFGQMSSKAQTQPVAGTNETQISMAEIFDTKGGSVDGTPVNVGTVSKCIQLRVAFNKPPKVVETAFQNNTLFKLQKLRAIRTETAMIMQFALRAESSSPFRYAELREIRALIFDKYDGALGERNVREINFLPPDSAVLRCGFLKISLMCEAQFKHTAELVSILADAGYYIMQMDLDIEKTCSVCTVIAYPLPVNEENSQLYLMDNVICSEDVSEKLEVDLPDINDRMQQLLDSTETAHHSINCELIAFKADPLHSGVSLPVSLRQANKDQFIYLEIEANPIANNKIQLEAKDIDEVPRAAEGFPKTGCGLVIEDAKEWSVSFPKIIQSLTEAGYEIVYQKVDHMILIDRPIVLCILKAPAKRGAVVNGESVIPNNIKLDMEAELTDEVLASCEAIVQRHLDKSKFGVTLKTVLRNSRVTHYESLETSMLGGSNNIDLANTRNAKDLRRMIGELVTGMTGSVGASPTRGYIMRSVSRDQVSAGKAAPVVSATAGEEEGQAAFPSDTVIAVDVEKET